MEGCAISVSEILTLPAQPVSGTLERIPLGGDGFTAPIAAYVIQDFALTGDAGGNNVSHHVAMDERFCSLVAYMSIRNVQATELDADVLMQVGGPRNPILTRQELVVATDSNISTTTIATTWNPTPYMLPGGGALSNCNTRVLNVLGDVVSLDVLIYLFNISVREKTAMGPLLWSRGAT